MKDSKTIESVEFLIPYSLSSQRETQFRLRHPSALPPCVPQRATLPRAYDCARGEDHRIWRRYHSAAYRWAQTQTMGWLTLNYENIQFIRFS